jgi:hypothetical protein
MPLNKYLRSLSAFLFPLIILFIFFGSILRDPGKYFFAPGGDGLKSYFGSYYHLKYDENLIHSVNQNYPYGESVFYGDSQPFITNILVFLKNADIDLSDHLVAILNLIILFSIVLGAYILYFLLRKLGLPYLYSLLVASVIAFLSPQLDRLGGHFSLSYVFMIPLFLYLYYRFFLKPGFLISILTGLLVFIGLGLHAYYFAFFGLIILFGSVIRLFDKKENFRFYPDFLIHITIQLIIPYLFISAMSLGYPADRTAYPWGFFNTKAFFESVFLPNGKPYARFIDIHYLNWEGIAFIGMVAGIGFIAGVSNYFKTHFREKPLQLHSHPYISMLLWVSILALFFSFTFPFSWCLEWLWNYMGPLRQFRASGRFAWIFYYVINIAVFYSLWKWYESSRKVHFAIALYLCLLWGFYDAYLNVRGRENVLKNIVPELNDKDNKMPANQWINKLNISDYQAIISLPYYHIGSEAYWIDGSGNSAKYAFMLSWKTGLPICDVMLSRTSISQSVRNIALKWEPLQQFSILNDFPNKKDILLMVQKGEVNDENELRLITYSMLITENEQFFVYRLPFNAFEKIRNDFRNNVIEEMKNKAVKNGFLVNSTEKDFRFISYGDDFSKPGLKVKSVNPIKAEVILDTVLFMDTLAVKISLWMKDLDKDLMPRTRIILNYVNSEGNFEEVYNNDVFKVVKFVDKAGWGMLEIDYKPKSPNEKIRIYMTNNLITKGNVTVDNILIRPADLDIFFKAKDFIFKNNRIIRK